MKKQGIIVLSMLLMMTLCSGCGSSQSNRVALEGEAQTAKNTSDSDEAAELTEKPKPSTIDQDVLDLVRTVLEEDKVAEGGDMSCFDSCQTGMELKINDLDAYLFSSDEKNYLSELKEMDKEFQSTHIYSVDIDNDGTNEIAIAQYQGGTMGNVAFTVFKKNDQGEFVETQTPSEDFLTLSDTCRFIQVSGKNYLLIKKVNFQDKIFSDLLVYRFKNGKQAERADFSLYSEKSYTVKTILCNSQYTEYLKTVDVHDAISATDKATVKCGSAEAPTHDGYKVDINNDGKDERLRKSYTATSVYYYPSFLELGTDSGNTKFDGNPLKAITGTDFQEKDHEKFLQQFWCDRFQNKTVTAILYRNKMEPVYFLEVYLLKGGKAEKIGELTATPVKKIQETDTIY